MQAAMRVGAAYVPLDPRSPPARIAQILTNCQAAAVVTTADWRARLALPPGCGALVIDDQTALSDPKDHRAETDDVGPEDLAYILHTSGSTGVPKGVCISHRAALAFVGWAAGELAPTRTDRFANHAPFHFDLSVLDIYVSMSAGARLFLIADSISYVPASLTEFAARHAITVWYSVPSALVLMLDRGGLETRAQQLALRTICFAGEVFPIGALRRLRSAFPEARLLNLYGPTETNVCAFFEVTDIAPDRIAPMPIGRACCGDRIWARNDAGEVCLPGEVGELIVDGPTVMSGYWGHPAQVGPYPTGDLVRADEAGRFTYLGRADHMVKVRGHRVELGEIEAALSAQLDAEIEDVAVVVVGKGDAMRLRACLVAKSDPAPSLLRCKQACAALLPRYMIVDEIIYLDRLARTANGKVDRAYLANLRLPGQEAAASPEPAARMRRP
jgi:clorobiocin biosynthesis protein CloN4